MDSTAPASAPAPRRRPSRHDRLVVALFGVTMVLSAALLFVVQPMVARFLLPRLGGTPTVWTTSQLFFQVMLLLGYVYAHASIRWLGPRRQALLHGGLVLVPLVVLPLAPAVGGPPTEVAPALWLIGVLLASVGAPFLAVSATAPLVQRWLADLDHPRAENPYFLYRASNVGSVVGLVGYPFVVEPRLGLDAQGQLWSVGYGALIVVLLACVAVVWRYGRTAARPVRETAAAADPPSSAAGPPGRGRVAGWVFLAAVPSSLSLGTTTYLSTDVAPFPLLWVIPLALYLFTFVVGFGSTPRVERAVGVARRLMPAAAVLGLATVTLRPLATVYLPSPLAVQFVVALLVLFVVGLACHGQLAGSRPPARRLTGFYIWVSIGGALGGAFNALAAPALFHATTEYPFALALALLPAGLAAARRAGTAHVGRGLAGALAAAGVALLVLRPDDLPALMVLLAFWKIASGARRIPARLSLSALSATMAILLVASGLSTASGRVADRDFFGSVAIRDRDGERIYRQGTTLHGTQRLEPALRLVPTSYYHPTSPIGDVVREARRTGRTRSVAVTGLGTGAVACLGRPGEAWRFFEIAPLSIRLASDPRQFTYVRDCPPEVSIVEGDARIEYDRTPGRYGLAAMDAFASDAIPVHLLTREAVRGWFARLAPDGLLAYHLSNNYLDLPPVVADLADDLGLACRIRLDSDLEDARGRRIPGKTISQWAVLARSPAPLGELARDPDWKPCRPGGRRVWTDDYTNVIAVIKR